MDAANVAGITGLLRYFSRRRASLMTLPGFAMSDFIAAENASGEPVAAADPAFNARNPHCVGCSRHARHPPDTYADSVPLALARKRVPNKVSIKINTVP